MFCVYMPYDRHPFSFTDYLNTLGEIRGLIDANPCSVCACSVSFSCITSVLPVYINLCTIMRMRFGYSAKAFLREY